MGIREDGTANIAKHVMPKSKCMAAFKWTISVQGATETQIAICRVNNVKKRGVPFPDELKHRISILSLHRMAYIATAGIDKSYFVERGGIACECAACVCASLRLAAKHDICERIEYAHVDCARVRGD